jgi:hypothetical protein
VLEGISGEGLTRSQEAIKVWFNLRKDEAMVSEIFKDLRSKTKLDVAFCIGRKISASLGLSSTELKVLSRKV